jgi:hypothetical protein
MTKISRVTGNIIHPEHGIAGRTLHAQARLIETLA